MATATESRPKPAEAPPPPTPPEHAQPKDKEEKVDFYGYLYEVNKTPTKTFDALLRAIGKHIIDHLGDKNDKALKPSKLAAFYKAVGGDYDKLFVHAPHESISYIWQVFGCRHTLEPTDSDDDAPWNFEPPTIPAVTLRGFVRWESIQILLTPEEHVPFILHAVRHWNLRHPDTGEPFPADIATTSFPTEPDAEITAWYESCGEKLRKEATPKATSSPRPPFPSSTHHDRVHAAFSHVRAPGGRAGTPDYFSHHGRSVPFAHVSPGHHASSSRHTPRGSGMRGSSPEPRVDRMSGGTRYNSGGVSSQEERERARRRSFSDYPSPHASPNDPHGSAHLHSNPQRPTAARRHSHPRRVSPDPDDTDSDGGNASPRSGGGRYSSHRSPRVAPRFVHIAVPSSGPPSGAPSATASPSLPHIRTDVGGGGTKLRPDSGISPGGARLGGSSRKGGVEGAKDWAKEKLTSIFPLASSPSSERVPTRKSPGGLNTGVPVSGGGGGSRDSLGRARSYDDGGGSGDSDSELERERRRRRRARERERREREAYEREQQRARRSREDVGGPPEWDDVGSGGRRARKDRDKEKERYLRRPDNARRTSSHADIDRLERERMHRYDYAADGGNGSRRPSGLRGRGARPLEEEELRGGPGPRDRTASPVIKGVGGRRYPAPPPESPPV